MPHKARHLADPAPTLAPMVPIPGRGTSGKVNVLLIGGGGREHALALRIAQSPRLGDFYTTHPENPGLAAICKPVDVPVSILDNARARRELGWSPRVSMEEGLGRTAAWLRQPQNR